MTGNQHMLPLT